MGTSASFQANPTGQARSDVTYPCSRPNAADYGRGSLYYDAFRQSQDQVICYEAKVGYVTGSFAANQMTKDAALLALGRASNDPGKRSCNATEWHLFASAVTGRIGASADMIAKAKQLGIKIVVHLPR